MSDPSAVEYCTECSLWHVDAPCDHDPSAACLNGCGRPRGFRWLDNKRHEVKPRTRCWKCWLDAGMPGVEGAANA
jgi:hypothetical protein